MNRGPAGWCRRVSGLVLFLLLGLLFCGCGKKAHPRPRQVIVPRAIDDLTLDVRPGKRFLAWSVPRENTDGSRPADIELFAIYVKVADKGGAGCITCDEGFVLLDQMQLPRPRTGFIRGKLAYYPLPLLPRGRLEAVKVIAKNRHGWFSKSSNKLVVYGYEPFEAPKKLTAVPDASVAKLQWEVPRWEGKGKNIPEIFGYRIYRRGPGQEEWQLVTPEVVADHEFIDVGLRDWTRYEYAVTTLSVFKGTPWESRRSPTVVVMPGDYTPPAPVAGFSAFPYQGGVQLVWQANREPDLLVYRIYKTDEASGKTYILELPARKTDYFDRQVVPGRSYAYKIAAVDNSRQRNESKISAPLQVRLP